jgi:hypothetical protein
MLGKGPAGQHLVSSVRGSWDMVGVAVYGDAVPQVEPVTLATVPSPAPVQRWLLTARVVTAAMAKAGRGRCQNSTAPNWPL